MVAVIDTVLNFEVESLFKNYYFLTIQRLSLCFNIESLDVQ